MTLHMSQILEIRVLGLKEPVNIDQSTGERLYKITKGLPGDISYASAIFEQFGLDFDSLKEKARKMNQ